MITTNHPFFTIQKTPYVSRFILDMQYTEQSWFQKELIPLLKL